MHKRSRNTVPATGWKLKKQLSAQRGGGTSSGTPGGRSQIPACRQLGVEFHFPTLRICRTRLAGHWGTVSVPAPSRFWPAHNSWISCLLPGRCDTWTDSLKSESQTKEGASEDSHQTPGDGSAEKIFLKISLYFEIWFSKRATYSCQGRNRH